MSLITALLFLAAGIACLNRPAGIARWIADAIRRASHGQISEPSWLTGRGIIVFIRFLGVLALINAVMLFYIAGQPTPLR